jgi:hypothetical protein
VFAGYADFADASGDQLGKVALKADRVRTAAAAIDAELGNPRRRRRID